MCVLGGGSLVILLEQCKCGKKSSEVTSDYMNFLYCIMHEMYRVCALSRNRKQNQKPCIS